MGPEGGWRNRVLVNGLRPSVQLGWMHILLGVLFSYRSQLRPLPPKNQPNFFCHFQPKESQLSPWVKVISKEAEGLSQGHDIFQRMRGFTNTHPPVPIAEWILLCSMHLTCWRQYNAFRPFKQEGFKYFLTWNHPSSGPDPNLWCSHLLRTREPLDIISKCAESQRF